MEYLASSKIRPIRWLIPVLALLSGLGGSLRLPLLHQRPRRPLRQPRPNLPLSLRQPRRLQRPPPQFQKLCQNLRK